METPVLTQREKSKALSGQKRKKVKSKSNKIKNVLTNLSRLKCLNNILSEKDSITFEEHLKEIFPSRGVRIKPKWYMVKTIAKEKRAEFRAKLINPPHPLTCNIKFGVNEVTRSVENQSSKFVFVSDDITRPMLVRHIRDGCVAHSIPCFEVPDLRGIAKRCFGFSTIAMAFVNIPDEFKTIHQFLQLFTSQPQTKPINVNEIKQQQQQPQISHNIVEVKAEYLVRSDLSKRCFMPSSINTNTNTIVKVNKMEFIELDTPVSVYENLRVKRIQPNPKRLKGKKK